MEVLDRPTNIYLETPILMDGVKVGHTYEGLVYMIEHYEYVQKQERHQQQSLDVRFHLQQIIDTMKYHKLLYQQHNPNLI